jgi:ABC-type sugar transport system substrate-binding protein
MQQNRHYPVFALIAAALLGLMSLAPLASPVVAQDAVVIGYSAPEIVGAQLQIQQGLVDHAEAKGWEVLTTTSGPDAQKQLDDINNYIAQEVDAIVAVPQDSAGICAAVEAANEAGIPFYTIDRSPSGCAINMTVLSDNYLAGQQSAEEFVKLLTERHGSPTGRVLEITGDLAHNVAHLRGGGFNDVMAEYPEIEIITKVGNWDAVEGGNIVRDVASTETDLDAIYMHSDAAYMDAVIAALEEVDRLIPRGEEGDVFLAGVDGAPNCLQAIRDGATDQCSSQPIPDFGIIVNYIEMELNGEEIVPGEVVEEGALWSPARVEESDVGLQLILATTSVTPENVDDERLWGNISPAATPEA